MANVIRLKGNVVHGVIRGKELIERFSDRLHGLIGFKPFSGTLNVKVDHPVSIEDFETMRIQHVLSSGVVWIDARLAPVRLHFKGQAEQCWLIREERGLHDMDVIELISEHRLFSKMGMTYGDEVEVELTELRHPIHSRLAEAFRSIWPRHKRVIR